MSDRTRIATEAARNLQALQNSLAELGALDRETLNQPGRTTGDAIADVEEIIKAELFEAAAAG